MAALKEEVGLEWRQCSLRQIVRARQLGQHKKKIFHQMFLCLHGGWQRFVSVQCQMQIVTVLSDRYWGAVPEMEMKQIVQISFVLNAMCYW